VNTSAELINTGRKLKFEVRYQVLAHLSKEIFLRGTYNKLKLKNIGPCKILRRFGENAYELELPEDVGISPIFNIVDLYVYREDGAERDEYQGKIQWKKQMPVAEKSQMERLWTSELVSVGVTSHTPRISFS
jgi:hypothetical protein